MWLQWKLNFQSLITTVRKAPTIKWIVSRNVFTIKLEAFIIVLYQIPYIKTQISKIAHGKKKLISLMDEMNIMIIVRLSVFMMIATQRNFFGIILMIVDVDWVSSIPAGYSIQLGRWIEINRLNLTVLSFYIRDFSYLNITQIPKTDPFTFINNIGGGFGLFMGLAFPNFAAFLRFVVDIFITIIVD